MEHELRQFAEHILSIMAPSKNVFGGSIPGILGGSAASGTSSALNGNDVLQDLKQHTMAFCQTYSRGDAAEAEKLADKIEGSLMVAQTVGILSDVQMTNLIDELHGLLKESE